jgi:hypothetical protein
MYIVLNLSSISLNFLLIVKISECLFFTYLCLTGQVNSVADAIRLRFTSKKWPLIVLHNKHLIGERMKKLNDHKLVQKWKQENTIYATPTGSNDDW